MTEAQINCKFNVFNKSCSLVSLPLSQCAGCNFIPIVPTEKPPFEFPIHKRVGRIRVPIKKNLPAVVENVTEEAIDEDGDIGVADPKIDVSRKGFITLREDGKFFLKDNPQIYEDMCKQYAGGVTVKEIQRDVIEKFGIEVPINTIHQFDRIPRYQRRVNYYRRNIGPVLRQMPGANIVQRVRVLSNIMNDADEAGMVKVAAVRELGNQLNEPKVMAMLGQFDEADVPKEVMIENICKTALSLIVSNKSDILKDDTYRDLRAAIVSTAEVITRGGQRERGELVEGKFKEVTKP